MNTSDLASACKRHGITTGCGVFGAWGAYDDVTWFDGPTEADAVAALLKARWGIVSRSYANTHNRLWEAFCPIDDGNGTGGHPTELAAVVALADRLGGFA